MVVCGGEAWDSAAAMWFDGGERGTNLVFVGMVSATAWGGEA